MFDQSRQSNSQGTCNPSKVHATAELTSDVGLGGQGVEGLGTGQGAGDAVHAHDGALLGSQGGNQVLVLGRLDVAHNPAQVNRTNYVIIPISALKAAPTVIIKAMCHVGAQISHMAYHTSP